MGDVSPAEKIEAAFTRAMLGDMDAFAEWMSMVEHPLRRSLARFARAVDVEVVLQETFTRMWLFATGQAAVLQGESASLRFAFKVARNVAFEELRRTRLDKFIGLEGLDQLPQGSFNPKMPDPALRQAINECFDRLPKQPAMALRARVHHGNLPDRDLAQGVRMKLNTFLQNIVRARKLVAECLERRGIRLAEILP